MASSQDQRQQERLSRQRGANAHKVENVGFSIQPLGGPATLPRTLKATSPPPPELPTRRTSQSASRINLPVAGSAVRKTPGPSQLHEVDTVPPRMLGVEHRASPNDRLQNFHESASNTPSDISTASTRRTSPKPLAVIAVTPVARGKRTRSPSPDRFLAAPEATGVAKQLVGGRARAVADQRQKEKIAARQRGAGTHMVADLQFSIQPIPGIQPIARPEVEMERWNAAAEAAKNEMEIVDVVEREEVHEQMQEKVQARVEGGEEGEGDGGDGGDVVREISDGGEEREREAIGEQTMEKIRSAVEQLVEEVDESRFQQEAPRVEEGSEDEAPIIPTKSPESRNKRRKVSLEQEKAPEKNEDPTVGPTPQADVEAFTEKGPEPSKLKWKQNIVRGKPASQQVPTGEEDEEGVEVERDTGDEAFIKQTPEQQGLPDLDGQELDVLSRPNAPKKNPNFATQSPKQPKPKPCRRVPREEGSSLTYPVLVHRLSKSATHKLPPRSNRSAVNPIDVINQVCMEMIDKYWAKSKGSHERKAMEAFKEELGYRFLELTDAVESNIILAARARQAQKRKAHLMLELLEVKRCRERVAVKMDDVRKVHEMATKNVENQNHISKTFSDITHTLERGKARKLEKVEEGMEGLEALVRKVSNAVTGGGSEGTGLLASVVEFNRFLERADAALKERRH